MEIDTRIKEGLIKILTEGGWVVTVEVAKNIFNYFTPENDIELIPEPTKEELEDFVFNSSLSENFKMPERSAFLDGVKWHQDRQNYAEVIKVYRSRIVEYKAQYKAVAEGLAISNQLVVRLEKENKELRSSIELFRKAIYDLEQQ